MCFKMESFNRHCQIMYAFERLQLGERTLKISKDLKYVVGVTAAPCSTIRRWHCKFTTEKMGINTDKPIGRPTSALNESNMAAVAKLKKEASHICICEVRARLSLLFGTVQRSYPHRASPWDKIVTVFM